MKLYAVRFLRRWGLYNASEVASFPKEQAQRLVKDGVAVEHKAKDDGAKSRPSPKADPSNRAFASAPVRK